MRKPVIRTADRTNQTPQSALARRYARTVATINNRFTVRVAATALRRDLFIEWVIEQDNFASDIFARHGFQFIKIFGDDHSGFNSLWRRGHAASKRAQNDLLIRTRRLTGKLNQRSRFFAAYPMRHYCFLKLHVTTECFQFTSNVFDRFCRLRRST